MVSFILSGIPCCSVQAEVPTELASPIKVDGEDST